MAADQAPPKSCKIRARPRTEAKHAHPTSSGEHIVASGYRLTSGFCEHTREKKCTSTRPMLGRWAAFVRAGNDPKDGKLPPSLTAKLVPVEHTHNTTQH